MNISLFSENKERNDCTFFHEIHFVNIFSFHSVFIIVFSKNICDGVKLTVLFLTRSNCSEISVKQVKLL